MNLSYKNNFSIEENTFIKIYKQLTKLQSSSNFLVRYFGSASNIFFRRLGFSLVAHKKKLFVNANISGLNFKARSTNSQFHSIYFDEYSDCYEPDVYCAIEKYLPNNGTMLDIGSNWGHHTFDAVFRKDATVYSFEPNVDVYNDLLKIRSDLSFEHKVTPYNFGLGSTAGYLQLQQTDFESGVGSVDSLFVAGRVLGRHWLARIIDWITFKKPIIQSAEVRVLDDVLDPKSHIDFIKIDCEGYELNALKGGRHLIARDLPVIVFEIHTDDTCSNYSLFRDFFGTIDYELFEINTDFNCGLWDIKAVKSLTPNKQYNLLAKSKSKS